ncbi:unnamed protein product [Rotaria magnacalcarata]
MNLLRLFIKIVLKGIISEAYEEEIMIAPKVKASFKTVDNQLKAMGIRYYKNKEHIPKYTEKQLQEIPIRTRRFYRELSKHDFELCHSLIAISYHTKGKVLFWPDLASRYYGHNVIHYLNDKKVKFLPIGYNPQNCPQSRPIETLWPIIDDMIYNMVGKQKPLID